MKYRILASLMVIVSVLTALSAAEGATVPKRIKLVILDNSGTTVDCGVYAPAVAFMQLFEKYGIRITNEEARLPMGLYKRDHIEAILNMDRVAATFRAVYRREWTSADLDAMFEDFIPIQMACLPQYSDVIPGIVATLSLVREKYDVVIGSTTGFSEEMNALVLRKASEQGYAPEVYTSATQVPRGRPYWYMVLENMRQAGVVDPEEVLKIGDTRADMQEGKAMQAIAASGTWTVGLSATGNYVGKSWAELVEMPGDQLQQGMQSAESVLYSAGADYVVPNLNSLPAIIELINARLANGEKPRAVSLDYLR